MKPILVSLLFVVFSYFTTISAQVKDIGCLLGCENGLMPGRCQCNPVPRVACFLNCDNGLVPGECRCNPTNGAIQQPPRFSCMIDCPVGTKLVESECRCENIVSLTQSSPCSGIVCSQSQRCRVINGRGVCMLSFFPSHFHWPRRTVSDSQVDRCQQRVEIGSCRAATRRYYFDSRSRRCIRFYYGGCGGNGNNFQTLNECLTTCSRPF